MNKIKPTATNTSTALIPDWLEEPPRDAQHGWLRCCHVTRNTRGSKQLKAEQVG